MNPLVSLDTLHFTLPTITLGPHMDSTDCVAYGPVIAILVAILKKLPWIGAAVARNPKVIATLVSLLGMAGLAHFTQAGAVDWLTVARCTATAFASAVATHEVVIGPVTSAIMPPAPSK
jgi:hypothetical protein